MAPARLGGSPERSYVDSTTVESPAGTRVADAMVGRVIGARYRVERRLARGGMATVYEAIDPRLDRTVALKVMHPAWPRTRSSSPGSSARRSRPPGCPHPHVVAVYDQGERRRAWSSSPWSTCPGRTLRDLLRERGRLTAAQALDDPRAGARGARRRARRRASCTATSSPRTCCSPTTAGSRSPTSASPGRSPAQPSTATSGVLIGTVAYLSPEQVAARHRRRAHRRLRRGHPAVRDAHRLGAVRRARRRWPVAYQHVNDDVPAPSSIRPGVARRARPPRRPRHRARPRPPLPADAATFLGAVREAKRTDAGPPSVRRHGGPGGDPRGPDGHRRGRRLPRAPAPLRARSLLRSRRVAADPGVRTVGVAAVIALLAVLLVGALVAGGAWVYGAARTVTMPAVVGLTPRLPARSSRSRASSSTRAPPTSARPSRQARSSRPTRRPVPRPRRTRP